MRIIGYLKDVENAKVTVFKSGLRYIVKFEDGFLEQSYKFLESDYLKGINDIRNLIDAPFQQAVSEQFERMRSMTRQLWERKLPTEEGEEWEEII